MQACVPEPGTLEQSFEKISFDVVRISPMRLLEKGRDEAVNVKLHSHPGKHNLRLKVDTGAQVSTF